jgi:hypothetical protein
LQLELLWLSEESAFLSVGLEWESEIISLVILVIGFIIGAIWATRVSMKHGIMDWLSGIRRIF